MTKKIILFALIISISLGMINTIPEVNVNSPLTADSSADPLLVGTTRFGYDLDPANAWDSASDHIIDQVSEGLFAYTLIDRDLTVIPRLASDYGSWNFDYTELTVPLRDDVTFHNGHAFNALAVKNSFDRQIHLTDLGELQTAELYEPLNGERVINSMVVIDTYTVKFVLNYQYAPFEALLCFGGSYIVDTTVMPANTIITTDDILIGTGPYKHLGKSFDGETVYFEYYPYYYRGIPAVKEIQYIKYDTSFDVSQALLDGEVHMGSCNPDYLMSFLSSDILTVEKPVVGTIITYMGMNNELIDKTMRQAISYAIDYDYIIYEIYKNLIVRMTSPVPPGITFHQPQNVATYDLDIARQLIIDEGLAPGLDLDSEDSEWIALAESGTPAAYYNYTYNLGNVIREDIGVETKYDLSLIGIEVEIIGVTWTEFLYKLYFYHYELNLYLIGWMPDYNDPSNYINPLFYNTSLSNAAQVDDPWLQDKMDQGLTEFDITTRRDIYYDIQEYITTDLMPWVFIGFSNYLIVHNNEVSNVPVNGMSKRYYFYCDWWGDSAFVNDPFLDFPEVDSDTDGLSDVDEINVYGTDPLDSDSDDDGLLDGEEVIIYDTDPLDDDSDNDGLLDGEEVNTYGTDPLDDDSDNDGLTDADEINEYETDPLERDTDGDDYDDGDEIDEGTDPLDPDDYPSTTIPGYPAIFVSIFLFSAIFLLIWKSKRKQLAI